MVNKDILENLGLQPKDFGNCYRMKPPYRNSSNNTSLAIYKENGTWYDFSEKIGGNFEDLLKILNKSINFEQAKELFQINTEPKIKIQKVYDKFILNKLIKDFSYWKNRGVSEETLKLFEGGICNTDKMANRYVFAIFNEKNELIGVTGRWIGNYDNDIKWKHIGVKTEWLFPLHLNKEILIDKKEVILVESIGDLLSLWDCGIKNVICTFGVDISKTILRFLLKYNFNKIIIAFNNEPDNENVGNKAAKKEFDNLLKYFDNDKVEIKLPTKKDFNEMNKEEINLWKNS